MLICILKKRNDYEFSKPQLIRKGSSELKAFQSVDVREMTQL